MIMWIDLGACCEIGITRVEKKFSLDHWEKIPPWASLFKALETETSFPIHQTILQRRTYEFIDLDKF